MKQSEVAERLIKPLVALAEQTLADVDIPVGKERSFRAGNDSDEYTVVIGVRKNR